MRTRYGKAGLAALSLACVLACNKVEVDTPSSSRNGLIAFEATTGSIVDTKTEYSHSWTTGSATSGGSREYIDWITGDIMRIFCKEADGSLDGNLPVSVDPNNNYCSDYRVTANTNAAQTGHAVASMEPFTPDPYGKGYGYSGLQWGNANTVHHIYAVYPSPTQGSAKDREGNIVKDPDGNPMGSMSISAGWHSQASANAVFNRINQGISDVDQIVGRFYVSGSLPSQQQGFWAKYDVSDDASREFRPNMNYATMVAYNRGTPQTDGSKIQLGFEPVFTALEFQIVAYKDDAIESDLKSAELSSAVTDLCGDFVTTFVPNSRSEESFNVTGHRNDNGPWFNGPNGDRSLIYRTVCTGAASNSKKVSIRFAKDGEADGNGVRLVEYDPANASSYKPITFTFLVLPQTYDNSNRNMGMYTDSEVSTKLTLTLNFKNGEKRTLDLRYDENNDGEYSDDEWVSVRMYKKSYFKKLEVPNTTDEWILDTQWIERSTGDGSTSMAASGSAGYYWKDEAGGVLPASATHPLGLIKSYVRRRSGAEESVAYTLEYREYTGTLSYQATENTQWGEWTSTAPSWLSIPAPASNWAGSVSAESLGLSMAYQTNSRPDYYAEILKQNQKGTSNDAGRFDLSFLNVASGAVTATRSTANAYVCDAWGYYKLPLVYGNAIKNGQNNNTCLSDSFVDHQNNRITSPYILSQNSSGTVTAAVLWTDAINLVTNARIVGSGTSAFLTFDIPQETVCHGNALVGVLIDGVVAWSWHIWVTHELPTMTAEKKAKQEVSSGYYFMDRYVGWCDTQTKVFQARKCQVRAVQTKSGNTSEPVTIVQKGHELNIYGNCTFYQWGRKDPLIGWDGDLSVRDYSTENNKVSYYTDENFRSRTLTRMATTLAESIQTPSIIYAYRADGRWLDPDLHNLWDVTLQRGVAAGRPVKTVYDPSPVGYCVPPTCAFDVIDDSVLQEEGERNGADYGFRYVGANGDKDLFLRATGFRSFSQPNSLKDVNEEVNIWTTSPNNPNNPSYSSTGGMNLLIHPTLTPKSRMSLNRRANGMPVLPMLDE